MHVYRKTVEDGMALYTVGYYIPGSETKHGLPAFTSLMDTSQEEEARALVNYLNGGNGTQFAYRPERRYR